MRKRISLLAASGLVVLGLATAPAHAADPVFTLTGPAEAGLRPHPGPSGDVQKTTVEFRVGNTTGTVFDKRSTFTIDLSAFKGIADVTLNKGRSQGCTQTATAVTCVREGLYPRDSLVATLELGAAKDSKPGTSADLTMTGKTEGATFKPATTKVKVGGPDLVLEKAPLKARMNPGDTQGLPIVFANAGTESVSAVALEIGTSHGMELVEKYDNCSYDKTSDRTTTVCVLDGEFKPGAVYEVSGPLTLKAAPHAFRDDVSYAVSAAGKESAAGQQPGKNTGGKKLAVTERTAAKAAPRPGTGSVTGGGADLDPSDNRHEFDFEVKNTADLAADAVSLKGKAGDTVKADLGFRNKGPAWVSYAHEGTGVARTDIVIPKGATVTKVPAGCEGVEADGTGRKQNTGAPRYFCWTDSTLGEQEKVSYPFELRIEKVVEDAKGSVTVDGRAPGGIQAQGWDPNRANDKALFVINAKDGGATPKPTASTGTPSPKPSSSKSPSPSASANTATTGGTGAKANGNLASTGSSVGPVALGAAVLVAAGGLLFVAARRRGTGRA
ncbi:MULTISPECIES: peptidase [unclassified Streptomyces]|uniref:peptidase n=1 Tax=unclassified Streptomyces TaxID=2593676 RepID=UPI00224EF9B7|nr:MULTISPECIES: peptidase [unclassified Streptomyces]MCX4527609.1 peptidase [Streptomyces sp. NBC_01551]MCX4541793.1 peptidase [Streptomyces sp. NBC_01565]